MGPGVGYRQDVELYIEKMDSDKELWETKSKTSRKIRRLRKPTFLTQWDLYTHTLESSFYSPVLGLKATKVPRM